MQHYFDADDSLKEIMGIAHDQRQKPVLAYHFLLADAIYVFFSRADI